PLIPYSSCLFIQRPALHPTLHSFPTRRSSDLLTLVTYPLVGHKETAEAKAGARKYVIYLLGAAKVFLLAAIILTYNVTGTLEFRDRKSTRLNSSHLGISYAVFCLKKKKKTTNN